MYTILVLIKLLIIDQYSGTQKKRAPTQKIWTLTQKKMNST